MTQAGRIGRGPRLVAAAAGLVMVAGCGGSGPAAAPTDAPAGYRVVEKGALAVVLPEQLVEPEGEVAVPREYDLYLQDDADPEAERVGIAVLGMTDARTTIVNGEAYDAADVLDWLVVSDPFGQAHPQLPERVDLSRDGLTVLRQDVPRGPEDDVYHLWTAQEGEDGRVVSLVLGGADVTDEVVTRVDETLTVTGEDA